MDNFAKDTDVLISRQAAIEAIAAQRGVVDKSVAKRVLAQLPSAQERTGKWIEKEVMNIEDSKQIEEWQSCRCSVCGRYDTRPYMYYFDEPHFCSWCGAWMEDEAE